MSFVINLDRRTDRFASFSRNQGEVERISAVENKEFPNVGCLLSHKKILEIATERGLSEVFIFEDDATFNVPLEEMKKCTQALSEKEPDWEVLLFSSSGGTQFTYEHQGLLTGQVHYFKVKGLFTGTFALAVKNTAFSKLLDRLNSFSSSDGVDTDVYANVCEEKIFITTPFLCYVLNKDVSDIRGAVVDDLEKVKWAESVLKVKTEF